MFAGLEVKPGSTVKCEPGYGFMLHLSQVKLVATVLTFICTYCETNFMLLLQRSDSSVAELAKTVVEKKQVPDIIGWLCFVSACS
jgi:hypothetical protein